MSKNWYKFKGEKKNKSPEELELETLEAVRLLTTGKPLSNTLGEVYLKSRKVYKPEWLEGVVWNKVPWHGIVWPVRDKKYNIIGCQITLLNTKGQKVQRINLGTLMGGAIWLGEGQLSKYGVIVGEGAETVLSAMLLHNKTQGLASMGYWNMRKVPMLKRWEHVWISVDGDEFGSEGAEALMETLDENRNVKLLRAPVGKDWNDVI